MRNLKMQVICAVFAAVALHALSARADIVPPRVNGVRPDDSDMHLRNAKGVLEEMKSDQEGRTLLYAGIATAFREVASDKPSRAVDFYFSNGAKKDWNKEVASELDPVALADFFTAGILLSGPQKKAWGIVGIYNPWWDAILLLELTPKETGEDQSPHVEVTRFYLLSGETFRGEPAGDAGASIRHTTVIPENDPISVEVWRVTSMTRKRFEAILPLEGAVGFALCPEELTSRRDGKLEMERIVVRAGIRLKLTMKLLKDGKAMGYAMLVKKMARDGNVLQLYSYFKEPGSRALLQSFAELPEMFRKDFEVYGYVPTKEGSLYVAVNKKLPRLYVTATIPADVPKTPASFEWYDLTQADALLSAWDNRAEKGRNEKEGSK